MPLEVMDAVITSFNKLQQDSQKIHRHASHRRETFFTTRSVKLLFDMRRKLNMTSHDRHKEERGMRGRRARGEGAPAREAHENPFNTLSG